MIEPSQKDLYAELLQPNVDLLNEHGRQEVESLSAVRRMKPFFWWGPDSYHWVEDSDLNSPAVVVEPDKECVEVGVFNETRE